MIYQTTVYIPHKLQLLSCAVCCHVTVGFNTDCPAYTTSGMNIPEVQQLTDEYNFSLPPDCVYVRLMHVYVSKFTIAGYWYWSRSSWIMEYSVYYTVIVYYTIGMHLNLRTAQ
jgi:hypothetical protein